MISLLASVSMGSELVAFVSFIVPSPALSHQCFSHKVGSTLFEVRDSETQLKARGADSAALPDRLACWDSARNRCLIFQLWAPRMGASNVLE